MKTYSMKINGNPYEVKILSIKKDQADVEVNGTKYSVDVPGLGISETTAVAAQSAAPASKVEAAPKVQSAPPPKTESAPKPVAAGAGDITAPLPGSIIKILVSEGDSVKSGEPIMIMEAMKMENEISAIEDGTVTKIHVKVGDNVMQGALLISIG